jgi:hypothetical protein
MRKRQSGFALVIALSLMAIVVLVVISFAALTRVETQSSSIMDERSLAQQNALLALHAALAELQVSAGPDQRVTATNNLREDPEPGTQSITGVWDASTGSFQRWLVSRQNPNEASNFNLLDTAAPVEQVGQDYAATNLDYQLLLGSRSVTNDPNNPDLIPAVVAQTVSAQTGRFAWWVGDEGVKANLRLRHAANPSAPQPWQTLLPRRPGLPLIDPGLGSATDFATIEQAFFLQDLGSIFDTLGSTVDTRERFHDFSVDSLGVLSDVRRGGLRKNLSAAFLQDAEFAKLLLDAGAGPNNDSVFGRFNSEVDANDDPGGPRWAQLRSFFRQGEIVSGNTVPMVLPSSTDEVSAITPIFAQAQLFIYVGYMADLAAPQQREVVFILMPAVVLWNPYNKTINTPDLYVHFANVTYNTGTNRAERQNFDWGYAVENSSVGNFPLNAFSDLRRPALGAAHRFRLPPTTIAPGATVIFSPSSNQPYLNGNPNNLLAVGFNPDFGFYRRTGDIFTDDGITSHRLQVGGRQVFNGYWDLSTSGEFFHSTNNPNGLVQRHTQVSIFGLLGSNPTGFSPPPAYQPAVFGAIVPDAPIRSWPLVAGSLDSNFPRFGYKVSLRLNENQIDDFFGGKRIQWLGQHNPRAPFTSKSPLVFENFVPLTANRGLRDHPNFAGGFTSSTASTWAQIQENFSFSGANIGYADTAEGNDRAILFEVPDRDMPFVSLVQLGMANMARTHRWDNYPFLQRNYRFIHGNYKPAFPLGNSIPDARIPAAQTGIVWRDHPRVTSNRPSLFGVHYDFSYRLNEALFDRFFLSSEIPSLLQPAANPVAFPLPNSRLIPVLNGRPFPTYAALRDYDQTAEGFMVEGSFNVNSTSVAAWATLIGSFFGTDVSWRNPAGVEQNESSADQNPVTRMFRPTGSAVPTPGATVRDDRNYTGYRRLNADQIRSLSEAIVDQIRARRSNGQPFLSLASFVNRDPTGGPTSQAEFRRRGVLQAAIDASGINAHLKASSNMVDLGSEFITPYPDQLMQGSISTGVPGFLMQSDLLLKLSPFLSARSDTFRVRAYGSGENSRGEKVGEIWCEAVVQRIPEELEGFDGRRFVILSFRWLNADEI